MYTNAWAKVTLLFTSYTSLKQFAGMIMSQLLPGAPHFIALEAPLLLLWQEDFLKAKPAYSVHKPQ